MTQAQTAGHRCYRCAVHEVQGPFRSKEGGDGPELESVDTTFAEGGDEVFFASGYSAREIAQKHARETGGHVYINNLSRNIRRRDLSVPVAYAVAKRPIYTLRPPDAWHPQVYRAYWPPLEGSSL